MNKIVLSELDGLRFEENGHRYVLHGTDIPSVSQIMAPLSHIEYKDIDKSILDKAAKRGTGIHNCIENYIKYGVRDFDPEYQGYANGFMEWWNQNNPEVIGSEYRVYHSVLMYAGTIDLLAYINGELCLIDYKTTYRLIDKNCRVQLEGYSQALKTHGVEAQRKHILHLQKDGKWQFPEYPAKDHEALRTFMALKTVYDYVKS